MQYLLKISIIAINLIDFNKNKSIRSIFRNVFELKPFLKQGLINELQFLTIID